jgi:zinc transporter ZupT
MEIKPKNSMWKRFIEEMCFKNKKSVGILVLIASIIHNVIDGITIGLIFSSRSYKTIISTNVAMVLHEIPKELGDAGILMHSGFNIQGVLFWNTMVNLCSIFGTLIGLSVGDVNYTTKAYSLAFVCGNFLYIALSQMLPITLNGRGVLVNILHFLFFIVGLGFMYGILFIE